MHRIVPTSSRESGGKRRCTVRVRDPGSADRFSADVPVNSRTVTGWDAASAAPTARTRLFNSHSAVIIIIHSSPYVDNGLAYRPGFRLPVHLCVLVHLPVPRTGQGGPISENKKYQFLCHLPELFNCLNIPLPPSFGFDCYLSLPMLRAVKNEYAERSLLCRMSWGRISLSSPLNAHLMDCYRNWLSHVQQICIQGLPRCVVHTFDTYNLSSLLCL